MIDGMVAPSWFVFEVTSACNADCPFCYNIWKGQMSLSGKELTPVEIEKLFTRLRREPGIAGITLAGGEPLARPDLVEIVRHCVFPDIPVGITTNGLLLDALLLNRLLDAGAGFFEVALPAADPVLYGKMMGRDDISGVRRALVALGAARVPFTVSFIITAHNWKSVSDVIDMAIAFGAAGVNLNRFIPGGKGLEEKEALQPSPEDLADTLDRADRIAGQSGFTVVCTIPVEDCLFPHGRWPSLEFTACICGVSKWAIGPDGGLRTCEQNPQVLGNLLEQDFGTLAALSEVQRFKEANRSPDCRECGYWAECGGGCRFG